MDILCVRQWRESVGWIQLAQSMVQWQGYEYSYEHSDDIKSLQFINQLSNFSTITPFQEERWLGNVIQYIWNHAQERHSLTDYTTPPSENLKWKREGLFLEYT